jgi:probable HAF family extracellular repeat protein
MALLIATNGLLQRRFAARRLDSAACRLVLDPLEDRCLLSYTLTDLGALPATGDSRAYALNDKDQIVGSATPFRGDLHAVLWKDGVITDLGALGGSRSEAFGINDQGQVVGASFPPGNYPSHAFLWQDGMMRDLGTLGGSYSGANGINNQGQVVGDSYLSGNKGRHAFLWQDGVMADLNGLVSNGSGWMLYSATAINQGGQIVGTGTTPDGLTRAFLLTPDPPSATAGSFLMAVAFAHTAGQPPAIIPTVGSPSPEQPNQQPPATIAGESIRLEAIAATTPGITPRHVQDTVLAELANSPMDTLSFDLAQ